MLWLSPLLTGLTLLVLVFFAAGMGWAMGTFRPIFRERAMINAEVTGRLTESLSGIRVVKGYHGEAREAAIVLGGGRAAPRQRPEDADLDVPPEPLFRPSSSAPSARR